jgi:serine/threonine kinase 3
MEGGPEDYTLQEKLGEGSFGKVYKALEISTGRTVAVKIVPIEQDTGEVAREIEMLKTCNSANIVRYYNSFTRGSELWIVMEFCAGSSLGDIMEARSRCLTEAQIAAVLAGTLAGLAYLHDLNKIHRDIKAGNLLLTDKGQVKLADFGVSAQARSNPPRHHPPKNDRKNILAVDSVTWPPGCFFE